MTISAVVTETEINASVTQLSNSVALTETEINASVSQTPISANVTSSPVSASVTAGTSISVAVSQNTISASISSSGGGVTDHSALTNLSYALSGHTGFQATLTADVDYLTPATAALTYQPIGSYLTDAPSDGTTYGRNNATWTAVSSGVTNHALLSNLDYASAGHTGFQAALSFPLAANLGGTGITNLAGSTLTLGGATTISTGGTIALGGFTLTVPATGTAALLATANVFTAAQTVTVDSATAFVVQKDGSTNALVINSNTGGSIFGRLGMATGESHQFFTGTQGALLVNAGTGGAPSFFFKSGATNRGYFAQSIYATGDMVFYLYANPAGVKFYISPIGRIGLGVGNTSPAARLHVFETTTTTNAVAETQRIEARVSTASTGGAAGFGVGQSFYAETATDGTYQQQGLISTSWIDATNATRKAKMSLSAYDTAARLGIEIEADGSAAKLGFYGVTTVARQVLATGVSATPDDIITALQNLGLVKQS